MSHDLPAHANLEHLRKQAKDRLRELRGRQPGAKLADAQHAIAREYGFASWPKLKAHVATLADTEHHARPLMDAPQSESGSGGGRRGVTADVVGLPPPNHSFERYTPKARQALFFSRYEASEAGSAAIEPEHVLLGLIRAVEGLTSRIFERVHLPLEQARAEVAPPVERAKVTDSVAIPFGVETKQILRYTTEEADRLLHRDIGLAHLLIGILRDERSVATSLLMRQGIRLDTVRDNVVRFPNEEAM